MLIDLLASLRSQIKPQQFDVLMKELQKGHKKEFINHVSNWRGKFIGSRAADNLLIAAVADSCGCHGHDDDAND